MAGCPAQALTVNERGKVVWDESNCTHCDQCIDVCRHRSSPKIQRYTVSQMLALIRRQHHFISGVTVSGGEATLQLPFLIQLFKAIKADQELAHLTCFVDSNGYLSQQGWQHLMPYLDGVMIDLKSWQNETHQWLVGRDNHKVISSIRLLAQHDKLHELRLLHIPGKSDLDRQIEQVARLINQLPCSVNVRLSAFQHHGVTGEALNWPKCSKEQMEHFHHALKGLIPHQITLPSVYI